MIDVSWYLNGQLLPNPHNARNFDTGSLGAPGTYSLQAVASDPADP